jgi:IS5 family transposase
VQVNLAYRWFYKLGIEDKIPDHSLFCRARHERFRESDALRRVFQDVVAMCIAARLVGGEAFSVDASLIKAAVDKKKRISGRRFKVPPPERRGHFVERMADYRSSRCLPVVLTRHERGRTQDITNAAISDRSASAILRLR